MKENATPFQINNCCSTLKALQQIVGEILNKKHNFQSPTPRNGHSEEMPIMTNK